MEIKIEPGFYFCNFPSLSSITMMWVVLCTNHIFLEIAKMQLSFLKITTSFSGDQSLALKLRLSASDQAGKFSSISIPRSSDSELSSELMETFQLRKLKIPPHHTAFRPLPLLNMPGDTVTPQISGHQWSCKLKWVESFQFQILSPSCYLSSISPDWLTAAPIFSDFFWLDSLSSLFGLVESFSLKF